MKRFTLSLVAVVAMFTLQAATASARAPYHGGGSSTTGSRIPGTNANSNSQQNLTNRYGNIGKVYGNLPVSNTNSNSQKNLINRYGNVGKVIGNFGNQKPPMGHGPVVPPTTPVTWGGNPPRAPSHGCGYDHHHHDHHYCGYWFIPDFCYDIWGYSSDIDFDFCW